jgi:serine/threonine-protein kinase
MHADAGNYRLTALMFTDLVGSTALKQRLGDLEYAGQIAEPHNSIFRRLLESFPGAKVRNYTGDGFFTEFFRPSDAVEMALIFQETLRRHRWQRDVPKVRIGIHLGQIVVLSDGEQASEAADICARVMSLAEDGQILLTRAVFDAARQYVRKHPLGDSDLLELEWLAHGRYQFAGKDEPMEVFEVGVRGQAALRPPADSPKARRADSLEEQQMRGWRPAAGQPIPRRPGWAIEQELGTGGFGEVWLAKHAASQQFRVFKFCFDAARLRSFKRELTLFRLLRDTLGDRPDIAPLLEVQLESPPFYLESLYVPGGNLQQWADRRGGISQVPLETRLGLFVQVARSVAAAHSVGIIHRDIKPANVLIEDHPDGRAQTRLADFGIGMVADLALLEKHGLTAGGFTGTLEDMRGSGTRMYAPPESQVGAPGTVHSDIYALGVLLYQMVVGDLERPLSVGWEHEIADELTRDDIRAAVRDIGHRLGSAAELADRIATLDRRRAELSAARRAEASALETARRMRVLRRSLVAIAVFAFVLGGASVVSYVQLQRAQAARRVADDLAAKNEGLLREAKAALTAEQAALNKAVASADREKRANEELEKANKDAVKAREEAEKAARAEKDQREKAEQLADLERRNREKAAKLSEFLIRSIQPEDSTRFSGATFFAPKANVDKFTVRHMVALEVSRAYEELKGAPIAQAAVLDSIGNLCRQFALFPWAKRLLNEALHIRRTTPGIDAADLAASCFHTAWYYHEVGDFEKAKPLYFEALEIRRKLPDGQTLVADTLFNLAWLYYFEEDSARMEQCFDEAVRIREKLLENAPDSRKALLRDVVYTKLGFAAAYAGASAYASQSLMLDAKRIATDQELRKQLIEVQGNEKLADALALYVSATDDIAFRDYAKAVDKLRAAISVIRDVGKAETTLAAEVHFELARTLSRLNRFQEAENEYQAMVDIARDQQMFQIPKQAGKIDAFGQVLRRLGKAADAEQLWKEYLAAQKFRFGEQHKFYKEAVTAYQGFAVAKRRE